MRDSLNFNTCANTEGWGNKLVTIFARHAGTNEKIIPPATNEFREGFRNSIIIDGCFHSHLFEREKGLARSRSPFPGGGGFQTNASLRSAFCFLHISPSDISGSVCVKNKMAVFTAICLSGKRDWLAPARRSPGGAFKQMRHFVPLFIFYTYLPLISQGRSV